MKLSTLNHTSTLPTDRMQRLVSVSWPFHRRAMVPITTIQITDRSIRFQKPEKCFTTMRRMLSSQVCASLRAARLSCTTLASFQACTWTLTLASTYSRPEYCAGLRRCATVRRVLSEGEK
jgi:hypothetical protein